MAIIPSDLWNMARVPSARATSTRPFTCLQLKTETETVGVTEIHKENVSFLTVSRHLHQAEHRVFEFDGVETLLPVSNR